MNPTQANAALGHAREPGAVPAELDVVELKDLEVRCVVGLYGHERTRVQPLVVHLAMHLDLRAAGESDEVVHTVDYGRLAGEVRFLLEHGRFRLIESAAETLARYLLLPPTPDVPRPAVQRVVVRIDKPEALRALARPAVVIARSAAQGAPVVERTGFGSVEVLHRSEQVAVARVRVLPDAWIDTHRHSHADEAELTLGDHLDAQGRPLPWLTAVQWPRLLPHRWHNRGSVEQTILRVVRPPSVDEACEEATDGFALPPTTDYAPAGTRA